MIVDILIGSLVFGYAGWTLYRFVKRSKQGTCSGCCNSDGCTSSCQETNKASQL